MRSRFAGVFVVAGLVVGACTADRDGDSVAARHVTAHDLAVVPARGPVDVVQESAERAVSWPEPVDGVRMPTGWAVAMIGEAGHLGSITDPSVADVWPKWQARPSLDGTTAAMTLRDDIARRADDTLVSWVSLPAAVETDRLTIAAGGAALNAVSYNGDLVALTNIAAPPRPGEIAGAKATTTLWIADRSGVRFEAELAGNFVAEAFGRRIGAAGLPEQVFLLEHLPAGAPRFYRVRVLSTATGEVSLPLNLRNKSQQVDERMSGLSRSQVIAGEHGLLFTLYRGTIDGTPDGDPYAFVHTLDLADGVWCLFLDPALELDSLPGSIAVGGDRLYVASANGKIGSFRIPSITDVDHRPEMDWVVYAGPASEHAPVLLADAEGVWIGLHDGSSRLIRLDDDGRLRQLAPLPGANPTALAFDASGEVIAVGDGWSTLGAFSVPDWFGSPAAVFAG